MLSVFRKVLFVSICLTYCCDAQIRKFSNLEGESFEAEIIIVKNSVAKMRLKNGRIANVPIDKFSTADQEFIKSWWQKNKHLLNESDIRLSISEKSLYSKKPNTKVTKKGKIKTSERKTTFSGRIDNFSSKSVKEISVSYEVLKRVVERSKKGSSDKVEYIRSKVAAEPLNSKSRSAFSTKSISSKQIDDKPKDYVRREYILGAIFTVKANGRNILTQSHPENLLLRIQEEKARQSRNEIEAEKRERSQINNRDLVADEKAELADRKRREAEAREARKREEEEKRNRSREKFEERKR